MARPAGTRGFRVAPILIALFAAIATVAAKDCCPPPTPTPTPTVTLTQTATQTARAIMTPTPTATPTCTPGNCATKALSPAETQAGFTGNRCRNPRKACGAPGAETICLTMTDLDKRRMQCCCMAPP
jgi:hypothetical protein